MYSSGWSATHYVGQADLELTETCLPLPPSPVLGSKVYSRITGLWSIFLKLYFSVYIVWVFVHTPACVCTLPHVCTGERSCTWAQRLENGLCHTPFTISFEAKSLPEPLELAVPQQAGSQEASKCPVSTPFTAGITAVHRIPSLLLVLGSELQSLWLLSGPTSPASLPLHKVCTWFIGGNQLVSFRVCRTTQLV